MHEILTIQCGNTANYVGTHFWNFQDPVTQSDPSYDIDHDVLFSSGQARNGTPTYTPRLLMYDSAPNFGSMSRINALYEDPTPQLQEDSPQEVVRLPQYEKHEYQGSLECDEEPDGTLLSDDNVKAWSDYNTQFFRPLSYQPIDSPSSAPSSASSPHAAPSSPFPSYESGSAGYQSRAEEVLDSHIRPMLEDCDLLQSFQLLSSMTDGWSGWTTSLFLDLLSEYPKIPKLLYSTTLPISRVQNHTLAQSLASVHDDLDAWIQLDASSSWRSSAIAGAWIDSLTVCARTTSRALRVVDVLSFMTPSHRIFGGTIGSSSPSPQSISGFSAHEMINRRFSVIRSDSQFPPLTGPGEDVESEPAGARWESRVVKGGLVTQFRHPSRVDYPSSYPPTRHLPTTHHHLPAPSTSRDSRDRRDGPGMSESWKSIDISMDDSATSSTRFLRALKSMVSGIRGAAGYTDRKDLVQSLEEVEGEYTSELFDEHANHDDDDDDDGF